MGLVQQTELLKDRIGGSHERAGVVKEVELVVESHEAVAPLQGLFSAIGNHEESVSGHIPRAANISEMLGCSAMFVCLVKDVLGDEVKGEVEITDGGRKALW